jgi:protein-ribulosamine 3-kinase
VTPVPASIRESVESCLQVTRSTAHIVSLVPVSGGCINQGCCIEVDDGPPLFLKWNPQATPGMFEAEADGLGALRRGVVSAGAELAVPAVIDHGETAEGSWLLLEYLPDHGPGAETFALLGRSLALLHGAADPESFGWRRDNWIGSLPQANTPVPDWTAFWRDRRILPQLDLARDRGHCSQGVFDRLVASIPAMSPSPCLLHGDLWSGNTYATANGVPAIIDPAVYRGDGEVDLAMTELFGGFGRAFYDAYDEIRPIDPGYVAFRRDLYQLYYLLVHVNLFGGAYEAPARGAAERVVAAVA